MGNISLGNLIGPRDSAEAVLKEAQELDEREAKMVLLIKKFKSLTKVIQMFNRI